MSNEQDITQQVRRRRYNRVAAASAATAVAGAGVLMFAISTSDASAAPQEKITICHRSNSNVNPYITENVSRNSILKPNGHATHTGPIWDSTLKGQGIKWGDIIPPFDFNNGHFDGLNWTASGIAIWENDCNIPEEPTPTITSTITPTETETSSASTEPSSTTNPPVVTVTATAAPTSEAAPLPAGVAAGRHTTSNSVPLALGGSLMLLGLGGLAAAVRPWKRATH